MKVPPSKQIIKALENYNYDTSDRLWINKSLEALRYGATVGPGEGLEFRYILNYVQHLNQKELRAFEAWRRETYGP